ncbi:thioesterase [Marinicaulis flavus]|uniref:Thioesterase n=2 Tax=Hyphococcus luteus TaxID=2058213 RepID=A0A2S7K384_9PROT|nr:thioesterase [Marinicaulis flavus]
MTVRTAEAGDIDELGHVNNAVYLIWAQDIATAHWRYVAPPKMQEELVWVALRHEIDYRDQVVEGESVEVRTWLGRASGPRFIRNVDIRKPGAARFSAKVETDWCLIDAKTRKPKRIGPEILALFGVIKTD